MQDAKVKESETQSEENATAEQMCCDGKRTASEHRHEAADGKCCSDS
jgi:hypothetical protein